MDIQRLYQILQATTVQLRKGNVVEQERVGALDVTHVYAMPHVDDAPEGTGRVDCVLLEIGVNKIEAERRRAEVVALLNAYPEPARLADGPSYIEVGGVIGDQGAAFQLFALGQVLGLWTVITPKVVGITDSAAARNMAAGGFVMISGYRPTVSA